MYNVTITSAGYSSDYELTKTIHMSSSQARYGGSYVSTLEENDCVIKGIKCIVHVQWDKFCAFEAHFINNFKISITS